jgi:hypothetical protein
MSQEPQPPERLSKQAAAAWHRIYANLASRNEWQDLYVSCLEVTACHCALYLIAARTPSPDPALVEDIRLQARRGLVEMLYVPAARMRIATLTPDGLDADISAVCATSDGVRASSFDKAPDE